MLSRGLRSPRAVQANDAIKRTFVKLKKMMNINRELADKITTLEQDYNSQFKVIFSSIQELINPQPKNAIQILPKKTQIEFGRDAEE